MNRIYHFISNDFIIVNFQILNNEKCKTKHVEDEVRIFCEETAEMKAATIRNRNVAFFKIVTGCIKNFIKIVISINF